MREGIRSEVRVARLIDVVDQTVEFEGFELVGSAQGEITVRGGLVFHLRPIRRGLRRRRAHGVLGMNLQAVEVRRHIGHRVVHTGGLIGKHHVLVADDVAPAGAEGAQVTHHAEGTGVRMQKTHAAEGELAVGGVDEKLSLAVENLAGGTEGARIGLKTVFEHEPDLKAFGDVFRPLQTEAGAGGLTGNHRKFVIGGFTGDIVVAVGVTEPRIHHAVKRHVGCVRRTAHRADDGRTDKRLFHFVLPFVLKSAPVNIVLTPFKQRSFLPRDPGYARCLPVFLSRHRREADSPDECEFRLKRRRPSPRAPPTWGSSS